MAFQNKETRDLIRTEGIRTRQKYKDYDYAHEIGLLIKKTEEAAVERAAMRRALEELTGLAVTTAQREKRLQQTLDRVEGKLTAHTRSYPGRFLAGRPDEDGFASTRYSAPRKRDGSTMVS